MRAIDRQLKQGLLGPEAKCTAIVWNHGQYQAYMRGSGSGYGRPSFKVEALHANINERGALEARLRQLDPAVILLIRSGHDCDCVSYVERSKIVNPLRYGLLVWQRMEDDHREGLDGPEHTWFEEVGEAKEGHWSRDCAMEAYEDGHPGHVTISDPEGAWE